MKKFNLKKVAQHAYKVCKAREAVIQAAKKWAAMGTKGHPFDFSINKTLLEAVKALLILESKGAKDGK